MTDDTLINKLETMSKDIDEVVKALKERKPRDKSNMGVLSENDFLLHEYDTLRAEIVQRILVRFTIITITMTVFAAVFAFSSSSIGVYLLMLYPLLSLLFMGSYIANSYGIRRLEKYIQDYIEEKVKEDSQKPDVNKIGWSHRKPGGYISYLNFSLSDLVSNMLFPVSSIIAWIVSSIILYATKFSTFSINGVNLTYLALWFSLVVVLTSIFFALFESRIFDVRKDQ